MWKKLHSLTLVLAERLNRVCEKIKAVSNIFQKQCVSHVLGGPTQLSTHEEQLKNV